MPTRYRFQSHGEFARGLVVSMRLLDIVKAHFMSRAEAGHYRTYDEVTYALSLQRQLEVQVFFNAVKKYPALRLPLNDGQVGIYQILHERLSFFRSMLGYESINDDNYGERVTGR